MLVCYCLIQYLTLPAIFFSDFSLFTVFFFFFGFHPDVSLIQTFNLVVSSSLTSIPLKTQHAHHFHFCLREMTQTEMSMQFFSFHKKEKKNVVILIWNIFIPNGDDECTIVRCFWMAKSNQSKNRKREREREKHANKYLKADGIS